MDNARLEHPILNIYIDGTVTEKRPSSFSLITDEGAAWVNARLQFPANTDIGKQDDPVRITLSLDGKEHLLFTGCAHTAHIHGAHRDLYLTDSYLKLVSAKIAPAYRKESAGAILQDILNAAKIEKTAITCPPTELARFSTNTIPVSECIRLFIQALAEHGHTGLRFFFDAKDTFHFGTLSDTGKNDGDAYTFETGKNILKKMDDRIEVLPLPIRHSQTVEVDGAALITTRTELQMSGSHSRLTLWLREAL